LNLGFERKKNESQILQIASRERKEKMWRNGLYESGFVGVCEGRRIFIDYVSFFSTFLHLIFLDALSFSINEGRV
jgi:hypothetical protein